MDKRALSNPPRGSSGGGGSPNIVPSFHIIGSVNEHQFIESVIEEHSYDSSVEDQCNVNDLLGIVNNILSGAISLINKDSDTKKDLIDASQIIMASDILHLIEWICCQMTCEATPGENKEERLQAIFRKLRSYRWTTQILLILAAFALQYGDFCYASEAPSEGRNALSTCLWKGLTSLKKKVVSDENKKKAMKTLNKVVNDLWELTNSLLDLSKLVNQHRGKHVSELARAFRTISVWSCETIIAIWAAGDIFSQIIDVHKKLTESELDNLKSSVSAKKSTALATVNACKRQIGHSEEYQKYVKKVEAPVDITDFLRSLLAKDPSQDPIVTGANNEPVKFETFRKKNVVLIISNLKISEYDILTLQKALDDISQIQTKKEKRYEIVWIPVVDARHDKMEELQNFKSPMPWAYMVDPHKMNLWAPKYIKEEWRFKRETMVVVLDSLGWVENKDAMPMIRIWGRGAYPYTEPWREPCNWFQLVIKDPVVPFETLDATRNEYVLFYGGTADAKITADVNGVIPNISCVHVENTKHLFIRLRSCLICRLQALQLKTEIEPLRDRIVYELCEAYKACQRGGFAILTKGPDLQMQHVGLLDTTLTLLRDEKWVRDLANEERRTYPAEGTKEKIKEVHEVSACEHVYIPDYPGLGDLHCPVCGQFMGYDLSFMCCHSGAN